MDGEGLLRRGVDVVLFFGVFAIERSCRSERKKSGRKKRESEKRSLFFEKKKHGNFKEQNSIPLSLTSCGDLAYSTSTGNVLPGDLEHGSVPEEGREARRVERRRGDDEPKVPRPPCRDGLEHAEQDVGVERALVGLVHDDGRVGLEVRVAERLAEEDAC